MKTPFVVIVALAGSSAGADVIHRQEVAGDDVPISWGYYSSPVPRPTRSYQHGDDFFLPGDTTIEGLVWWGIGEGKYYNDIRNVSGFQVDFFLADEIYPGNPTPGALIASESFTPAQTSPTETGRIDTKQTIEYRHEVQLAAPVELGPGRYYLSISATSVNQHADAWQWREALPANGVGSTYFHSDEEWMPQLHRPDTAFELHGVPAPATAAALSMGVCAANRRRR